MNEFRSAKSLFDQALGVVALPHIQECAARGSAPCMNSVLVTGGLGLVGKETIAELAARGYPCRAFDIRQQEIGADADIRDLAALTKAMEGCVGVVHLAAVSRVVWGERNPELCRAINVDGTRNVVNAALGTQSQPWVLFASSREVYGQAIRFPVSEVTPLEPMNVYARSKLEGERIVLDARREGLRTAVVRLSNVYGSTSDHVDRVIPAFVRASVLGEPLMVEGSNHTFDFTHVHDVARGLCEVAAILQAGLEIPPVHLVSGRGTTLGELARLAVELARSGSQLTELPSRSFDVSGFVGCPRRAQERLNWQTAIPLREGLAKLINDFRAQLVAELIVKEAP